jgi:uncharacterized phage infection (PIP) family protein YhgE
MALAKDSIYNKALSRFNRLRGEANLAASEANSQNKKLRNLQYRPIDEQLTDSPRNSRYYGRVVNSDAAGRGMLSSSGTQQNITDAARALQQSRDQVTRDYEQSYSQLKTGKRQALQGVSDQQEAALEALRLRNNARRGV